MDTIKRVAVYVRKSRQEEDNQALDNQRDVLIRICEDNKWKYDLYIEVGSSNDLQRPELQKMLTQVRNFKYNSIVCADQDRLSRNTGHLGQIKEIMNQYGCHILVTPSKVYNYKDSADDLMSDISSIFAKQELKKITERLIRGTRESAKSGNWLGKRVPIGYKYNRTTKSLELSEDAPVIKRMFMLYLEGISTKDIAYKFTNEGVKTTVNMKWTPAGISRMLNNIVYAGHSLYGRTTQPKIEGKRVVRQTLPEEQILVENTHEAIVSPELWEEVQKVKQDRNSRPPVLKLGKHKFSGLIRCGLCGGIHSFQTSRYKRKRISSCQTRTYNRTLDSYSVCSNAGANITEFEELFYLYFRKYVDQLEQYVELIKVNGSNDTYSVEEEIDKKQKQIKELKVQRKRVRDGFKIGMSTLEEAYEDTKELEQQVKTLENQIKELKESGNYTELERKEFTLDKMKQFLNGSSDMDERQANNILREFVETVIYTKTGTEITLDIVMK
ncbi:recombinase family protein [Bacillus nitratireducens]|uniref:recombinase family protein n=1 Tax=Bacillus nitratireducens TaxID=2026193 RepID=UPI001BACBEAE|nr:recombinase family protein [Bacillus nitratireducens]QUG82737.1 recombinase family protein [Bacillus nitratireducens]